MPAFAISKRLIETSPPRFILRTLKPAVAAVLIRWRALLQQIAGIEQVRCFQRNLLREGHATAAFAGDQLLEFWIGGDAVEDAVDIFEHTVELQCGQARSSINAGSSAIARRTR